MPPSMNTFKTHLQLEQPSCWRAGRNHPWRLAERLFYNTVRERKAIRLGPTPLAGNTEGAGFHGSVVLPGSAQFKPCIGHPHPWGPTTRKNPLNY